VFAARLDYSLRLRQRPSRDITRKSASYDVVAVYSDSDYMRLVRAHGPQRLTRSSVPESQQAIGVTSDNDRTIR